MARVTFSDRLVTLATTDARLQQLGHAAAMLWLHVVTLIRDHGDEGVALRMGSALGYANDIAMLLRIEQPHWETQIETLVSRGLLTRDEAGTLGLPVQLMPTRRELANRVNGRKSQGRPRKSAVDPTPAQDPRQITATMGIAGGKGDAVASAGNPNGNPPSRAPADVPARSFSLASDLSSQAQATREEIGIEEHQRVGRAAFQIPFDDARDVPNWHVVRSWLADAAAAGLSEAERETLILSTVRDVFERAVAKGRSPSHLGYFSKAVGEAVASFQRPVSAARAEAEARWLRDTTVWSERMMARDKTRGPRPEFADYVAGIAA